MSVDEMSVHCTVGEMSGSVKSWSVKGRSVIYHCTENFEINKYSFQLKNHELAFSFLELKIEYIILIG
jgi:hypothetical protein